MVRRLPDFQTMAHLAQTSQGVSLSSSHERRLHERAYIYWLSLLKGRPIPSIDDLDLRKPDAAGPHSLLLKIPASRSSELQLMRLGQVLATDCGLKEFPAPLHDLPASALAAYAADYRHQVLQKRSPVAFEAGGPSVRGNLLLFRGILMPLASDGATIDHMYGVISGKELP